jgi:hypothetical protein
MRQGVMQEDMERQLLLHEIQENNRLLRANNEILLRMDERLRKIVFNTNT